MERSSTPQNASPADTQHPHPQSWSWPSSTKYIRQNHVGTGGFLHGTHQKVPVALPSLRSLPQIRLAPLLSDGAAQLPRDPCQVRGVGNVYLHYSGSVLSKGKDGLCLPGTARRTPRGSRAGARGGSLPHRLHPSEREEPAPALLPHLGEQSRLAGAQGSTRPLSPRWHKISRECPAAPSPREVVVVVVMVVVTPRHHSGFPVAPLCV